MLKTIMKYKKIILVVAIVLILVAIIIGAVAIKGKRSTPKIDATSVLQEVIAINELSTSAAVYNGVAEVRNKENPEKIDYYVAYEATVKSGIDFDKDKLDVLKNEEEKTLTIRIPEIRITDITVKYETMEFIFNDKKANASTVTEEAYKACEEDVKKESEKQGEILVLAKENAITVIKSLTEPIARRMGYTLDVE